VFPILFEIGPITIYSFGFMLVVAFYTTYFLLNHDLRQKGYAETLASDMIFWGAVVCLVQKYIIY